VGQSLFKEPECQVQKVVAVSGYKTTPVLRGQAQLGVVRQAISAALVRADNVDALRAGNPRYLVGEVFVQVEAH
jgi:hypothetical protein